MNQSDIALLMDLYELTMAECYLESKKKTSATFDLFVRDLPPNRSFLVSCGLEDVIRYIQELEFTKDALAYLDKQHIFSDAFLTYLAGFKFKGDLWAMPEGTIFFPNEPVIRVTAPIIEAQIIESFLLNTINLQTMIATKAARVVLQAEGKGVYDFSLRRTHGQDAGIKVSRAAYIAGFSGTSCVLAAKLYQIPVAGTMAHSFVMSFENELESFLVYSKIFPERSILLVDTYDTKKGVGNAVTVGLKLKQNGFKLLGIRLDSGDIVSLSKFARNKLDKSGLRDVKIFASGNLDEFKIKEILKAKAPVDNFGVGTNMGVSADAPFLDVIYKISEVTDNKGNFLPTMKLSKGKITYPGRKQVFRIKDKKGKYSKDILGLEKESIDGQPLLEKIIQKGQLIYREPALDKIRALLKEGLGCFQEGLKELDSGYVYPVIESRALKTLRHSLKLRLSKRQGI